MPFELSKKKGCKMFEFLKEDVSFKEEITMLLMLIGATLMEYWRGFICKENGLGLTLGGAAGYTVGYYTLPDAQTKIGITDSNDRQSAIHAEYGSQLALFTVAGSLAGAAIQDSLKSPNPAPAPAANNRR